MYGERTGGAVRRSWYPYRHVRPWFLRVVLEVTVCLVLVALLLRQHLLRYVEQEWYLSYDWVLASVLTVPFVILGTLFVGRLGTEVTASLFRRRVAACGVEAADHPYRAGTLLDVCSEEACHSSAAHRCIYCQRTLCVDHVHDHLRLEKRRVNRALSAVYNPLLASTLPLAVYLVFESMDAVEVVTSVICAGFALGIYAGVMCRIKRYQGLNRVLGAIKGGSWKMHMWCSLSITLAVVLVCKILLFPPVYGCPGYVLF